MRTSRRRTVRLLAAACLGGALLAIAVTQASSGHSRRHTRRRAAAHTAALAQAIRDYSVLSRPASEADQENAEIENASIHDPALEPEQARVLKEDSMGRTWLIPTSDGRLCLGLEPRGQYETRERERGLGHLTLGYTCAPATAVDSRGITVRMYDDVVGAVPDGVTTVNVTGADSETQTLAVTHNTYRFSVHEGFVTGSVSFAGDTGEPRVNRF